MSGPPTNARSATWALTVLTLLNFLNYVDRFVLSAVIKPMHADPAFRMVSEEQIGYLQTAFLVVYMLMSPVGGALGNRIKRKYIAAGGVFVWTLATLASGLAQSYGSMLAARAMIGFGEAGYAAVAPAIISDLFSEERRARMLAVFYTATPVGSALGFVVGGFIAERWGWRHAFWAASAPGFVLSFVTLFIVEPPRAVSGQHGPGFFRDALTLLRNPRWLVVTGGAALMTYTIGGLGFWAPTYFQEARGLSLEAANTQFGTLTIVAGIIGTAVGGVLGDRWYARDRGAYLLLSGGGVLAAAPFLLAAPFVANLPAAFALFFVAELFIFLNTGPLNAALINSAEPRLREIAVGLNVTFIHLFGDAASPPLLGRLTDVLTARGHTVAAARGVAVASAAGPLVVGGILLLLGARLFRRE
jgi:predicted MFS family arabinose efflux permease